MNLTKKLYSNPFDKNGLSFNIYTRAKRNLALSKTLCSSFATSNGMNSSEYTFPSLIITEPVYEIISQGTFNFLDIF